MYKINQFFNDNIYIGKMMMEMRNLNNRLKIPSGKETKSLSS